MEGNYIEGHVIQLTPIIWIGGGMATPDDQKAQRLLRERRLYAVLAAASAVLATMLLLATFFAYRQGHPDLGPGPGHVCFHFLLIPA